MNCLSFDGDVSTFAMLTIVRFSCTVVHKNYYQEFFCWCCWSQTMYRQCTRDERINSFQYFWVVTVMTRVSVGRSLLHLMHFKHITHILTVGVAVLRRLRNCSDFDEFSVSMVYSMRLSWSFYIFWKAHAWSMVQIVRDCRSRISRFWSYRRDLMRCCFNGGFLVVLKERFSHHYSQLNS